MKNARIQVGFDISKEKLDMCIMTADGQVLLRHQSFANSLDGYSEVKMTIKETLPSTKGTGVDIGCESTGYYWLPFFLQLQGDADLATQDPRFYLINARHVSWFKKNYAEDDKTDEKDSFYVTEKLRFDRNKHPWHRDEDWLRLRFYTRLRFHLGQNLTRMKNYFWSHMFLWCSEYGHKKPFADGLSASGRALIRKYPDWETLQIMPVERLAEQLKTWSHSKLEDPFDTAAQIQEIIQASFPIPPELSPVLHRLLNMTIKHIEFIEQQIQQVETWMKQEVRTHHPEILHLMGIQGIGLVYAAGIAAEIGNIQRFLDGKKWDKRKKRYRPKTLKDAEDSVAKFAGIWWPRRSSGTFEGQQRRMSKKGNPYLRYYLYEAADKLRQYQPDYQAYYQRKYAETKKFQHKRALVLTARKSIGLFLGLLHRNEPYRSKKVTNV